MDTEKLRKRRQRYKQEHRLEINAYNLTYHRKKRQEAEELLGGCCYFCGHGVHLNFHKKSGGSHGNSRMSPYLVLKNPEEWALLCMNCHKAVHWCMKYLKKSWEGVVNECEYIRKSS